MVCFSSARRWREPGWTSTGIKRHKCVRVILGKSSPFSDLRFHNLNDLTCYNGKFLLSPCDQFSPSFGGEYTEIRNIRSLLSCLSSNWGEKTNIQGTVNLPSWDVSWAPSAIRGRSKKERWILVGQSTSTHLAEEERADTSLNQKQIHQANGSFISPYLLHQNSREKGNFSYLYREDS